MANPSRSLNALLSWEAVLTYLEVHLPYYRLLPAQVSCPLCRPNLGKLQLVADPVLDGYWASCPDCGFAGDLVELTAAALKLTWDRAVSCLEQAHLLNSTLTDADFSAYERDHLGYRQRLKQFWEDARQRPVTELTPTIFDLLTACTVRRHNLQRDDWLSGMGLLLGAAKREAAEDLFAPESYRVQPRANRRSSPTLRRGGGPGRRRLFRGAGWDEFLVLPYYDLPGRLCGFLFLGRDEKTGEAKLIYRRANLGWNQALPNAGVAWLPTLDLPGGVYHPAHVLLTNDPLLAIALQARHRCDLQTPLPILITYFGVGIQTRALPPGLTERQIVCAAPDLRLVALARELSCRVSTFQITQTQRQEGLPRKLGSQWMNRFATESQPWKPLVAKDLAKVDATRARQYLQTLGLSTSEVIGLLNLAAPDVRDRVLHALDEAGHWRSAIIRGRRVEESPQGWRIVGTDEMLTNFTVRLVETWQSGTHKLWYRATVRTAQAVEECMLLKSQVDRHGLLKSVTQAWGDRSPPLWFQPRWNRSGLALALQLHPPAPRSGNDRVGWQPEREQFVFPQFVVTRQGECLPEPPWPSKPGERPGMGLQLPDVAAKLPVGQLEKSPDGTAIGLVLLSFAASHLLRPVLNLDRWGLVVDGLAAQSLAAAAAQALGCLEIKVGRPWSRVSFSEQGSRLAKHDLPLVVEAHWTRRPFLAQWWNAPELHHSLLLLSSYESALAAGGERMARMEIRDSVTSIGRFRELGGEMLVRYLVDLCHRNFRVGCRRDGIPLQWVLRDVGAWFLRQGGSAEIVNLSRSYIRVDSRRPWKTFVMLLERLLTYQDLTWSCAPGHRSTRRPDLQVGKETPHGPAVLIDMHRLKRVLWRFRLPELDWNRIHQALIAAGAWLESDSRTSREVWCLSAEWLADKIEVPWAPSKRARPQKAANSGKRIVSGADSEGRQADGLVTLEEGAVLSSETANLFASAGDFFRLPFADDLI